MERDEEGGLIKYVEIHQGETIPYEPNKFEHLKLNVLFEDRAGINDFEFGENMLPDSFRRSADETGDEMWK